MPHKHRSHYMLAANDVRGLVMMFSSNWLGNLTACTC
jgi:hypothetical protein